MKKIITVQNMTVSPYELCGSFDSIVETLKKYEKDIYTNHPDASKIHMDFGQYDSYSDNHSYAIYYDRLEVDKEYETRIKREEKQKEEKRRSDLAMLKQLKAQYPD